MNQQINKVCTNEKCHVFRSTGLHLSDCKYCYNCGEELEDALSCCGRELIDLDNYCPLCGKSRKEIEHNKDVEDMTQALEDAQIDAYNEQENIATGN